MSALKPAPGEADRDCLCRKAALRPVEWCRGLGSTLGSELYGALLQSKGLRDNPEAIHCLMACTNVCCFL